VRPGLHILQVETPYILTLARWPESVVRCYSILLEFILIKLLRRFNVCGDSYSKELTD